MRVKENGRSSKRVSVKHGYLASKTRGSQSRQVLMFTYTYLLLGVLLRLVSWRQSRGWNPPGTAILEDPRKLYCKYLEFSIDYFRLKPPPEGGK
jgi:hypothetical protein